MDCEQRRDVPGDLGRTLMASGITHVTPKELEAYGLVSRSQPMRVSHFSTPERLQETIMHIACCLNRPRLDPSSDRHLPPSIPRLEAHG